MFTCTLLTPLKNGWKLCTKFTSLYTLSYTEHTNTRITSAQSLGVLTLSRDGCTCFLMAFRLLLWWNSRVMVRDALPSQPSVASLRGFWRCWCESFEVYFKLLSRLLGAVVEDSLRSIPLVYFRRSVSWLYPSWQLSPTQPLAHPRRGVGVRTGRVEVRKLTG